MEQIVEMFRNLTPVLWIGQIFGFVGLISYCLSVLLNKKGYFIVSAISYFCYAIEQSVSGLEASALTQIIGLSRSMIFLFFFMDKEKTTPKYIVYILLVSLWGVSLSMMFANGTYTDILNYLPLALVTMDTFAANAKNYYVLKVVLFIHQICYIFYYTYYQLPISIMCQWILTSSIGISIVLSIIKDVRAKKGAKVNA